MTSGNEAKPEGMESNSICGFETRRRDSSKMWKFRKWLRLRKTVRTVPFRNGSSEAVCFMGPKTAEDVKISVKLK